MKRILSMLIAISIIFTIIPVNTAFASTTIGECGDNLTWELDEAGILTISGEGAMWDWKTDSTAPWYAYKSAIKEVIIEDGVTRMGAYAFLDCTALASVTVPASVTSAGVSAFKNCQNIDSVYISDLTAWINIDFGTYATANPLCYVTDLYLNGKKVVNLEIPEEISEIKGYVFYGCSSIESVTIPEGVTSIAAYAFYNCDYLTSVTIPSTVTSIGDYAFKYCANLTDVYYVGTMEDWAALTEPVATNNAPLVDATIHYLANGECGDNLTWAIDEEGVLTISGEGAMWDWKTDSTAPWYAYKSAIKEVIIEDGVTRMGAYAFLDCTALASVTVPASVTSAGVSAFKNCQNIDSVHISDLTAWINIDFGTYATANPLCYVTDLYLNGKKVVNLEIPEEISEIKGYVFYGCSSIESVTIPEGVTSIATYAFYNCDYLTSVTIPSTVTSIGDYAFKYCANLTDVYYVGTMEDWAALTEPVATNNAPLVDATIHYLAYGECGDNLTWAIDEEGVLTISGEGIMWEWTTENKAPWYAYKDDVKAVVIENGVTSIGYSAFYDFTNLESVSIAGSVKKIEDFAFYNCTTLTSVIIPDGVTRIGERAFEECISLSEVTIPASITSIGGSAFKNCQNIDSVYISNMEAWLNIDFGHYASANPLCYGTDLYLNGEKVVDLVIPYGTEKIGGYAFYGCTSFESITIPEGVASIGTYAFYRCANVTSVKLANTVTSIEDYAFRRCEGITDVYYLGTEAEWNILTPNVGSNNEPVLNAAIHFVNIVSYDANGGSGAPDEQVKTKGEDLVLSETVPTREGYIFKGWSTTANGEVEYAPGATYSANEDITLYAVWEEEILSNGTCGENLTWTLNRDGTLTISGTGAMTDFSMGCYDAMHTEWIDDDHVCTNPDIPWFTQRDAIKKVIIANGVTSVGKNAFYECRNLVDAEIPESVTSIGKLAFYQCNSLEDITLPSGITTINGWTFSGCSAIKSITIPDGVTNIGTYAFYSCSSLTDITIPSTVTSIEIAAFYDCSKLTDVYYLGASIEWDELKAKIGSNNEPILNATTHFAKFAVSYDANGGSGAPSAQIKAKDEDITLSKAVPTYAGYIFKGWSTTADGAVEYAPGETYSANADVTLYAVWEKDITVASGTCGTALAWTFDEEGILRIKGTGAMQNFASQGSAPWYSYRNDIKKVIIDEEITSIGMNAFYNCINLTEVNIPQGVTSIPQCAFQRCSSLEEIELPENVTNIGLLAFGECSSLKSIKLPENLSSMATYAFASSGLESVIIPAGITTIPEYAFHCCESLASIVIPDTVTRIDQNAFGSCLVLADVYYLGSEEDWKNNVTVNSTGNSVLSYTTFHYSSAMNPTAIALSETAVSLTIGKAKTLTVTLSPENVINKEIKWESSNEKVASVENGTITAKAMGTAVITATSYDGSCSATCTVTVKAPVVVTGFKLRDASVTMKVGDVYSLSGEVRPYGATNSNVVWTSSDNDVVSVSADTGGIALVDQYVLRRTNLTAKKAGTAVITGTTVDGGYTATCTVTVEAVPITGIMFISAQETVPEEGTITLVPIAIPGGELGEITWTSDCDAVATVNNGVVTGISPGKAVITATTVEGGFTASCTVTVTAIAKEYAAAPVASIPSGVVKQGDKVSLYTSTTGADIYYTLDGTTPSAASNKYTEAILINESVQLNAIAIKKGMWNSEVSSFSYTLSDDGLPLVNVSTAFKASRGDVVTVSVNVTEKSGMAGGSFNLIYDNTAVELVSVKAGSVIAASNPIINDGYRANKIRVIWAGTREISSGGEILTVQFKVLDTDASSTYFNLEKVKMADGNSKAITTQSANCLMVIQEEIVETWQEYTTQSTINSDNKSVSVKVLANSERNGKLFVAVYTDKGILVQLKKLDITNVDSTYTFAFEKAIAKTDEVKVFVWDSLSTTKPLSALEIISE